MTVLKLLFLKNSHFIFNLSHVHLLNVNLPRKNTLVRRILLTNQQLRFCVKVFMNLHQCCRNAAFAVLWRKFSRPLPLSYRWLCWVLTSVVSSQNGNVVMISWAIMLRKFIAVPLGQDSQLFSGQFLMPVSWFVMNHCVLQLCRRCSHSRSSNTFQSATACWSPTTQVNHAHILGRRSCRLVPACRSWIHSHTNLVFTVSYLNMENYQHVM
jgi:hypothetical protein